MAFYNIYVANQAHLTVKNDQLVLENSLQKVDYPLEDVNSVMIENLSTNISSYTLFKLAKQGILTFICDQNHLPCGVVLPFCQHYQTLSQIKQQIEIGKPLQKQLWASIIKNKIKNQNEVLNICGGADDLKPLLKTVLSGDSSNNEAKASLIYFKQLFGKDFARRNVGNINSFLNYGYSIIRGFVARSIAVHGLMPTLGIFHSNQFNQFNLADDIMEIFRPMVDLYVKVHLTETLDITSDVKIKLFNLINYDVLVGGQLQTVSYAIDLLVQSFCKSLKQKKDCLKEICIIGLKEHYYE